jgi:DNA-binding transcriptional LysR family regulator
MGVDTTAMRWFQLVADGATVTEVAELEMVSQPGVSRALARLEDEVGAKLLVRSGRLLRLTRAGSAFKTHVDSVLHHYDDAVAAVAEMVDPETGVVALGFQLSFGTWLVPRLIASFREEHPRVRFVLEHAEDDPESEALLSSRYDLEITSLRPTHESLAWEPLFSQHLSLAVPSEHRLARRRSVRLEAVADEEFVMLQPSWALRTLTDRLCAEAGFEPRTSFECDDLQVVRGFVAAGLGVAVVPPREGHERPTGAVRVIPLLDSSATRELGLAWSLERRLLPSAQLFRAHTLREAAPARARSARR